MNDLLIYFALFRCRWQRLISLLRYTTGTAFVPFSCHVSFTGAIIPPVADVLPVSCYPFRRLPVSRPFCRLLNLNTSLLSGVPVIRCVPEWLPPVAEPQHVPFAACIVTGEPQHVYFAGC